VYIGYSLHKCPTSTNLLERELKIYSSHQISLKFHLYRNVTGVYFLNTSKHAKRVLGATRYYSIILGHKCILKKVAIVMEETTFGKDIS
jgi:hypothetical protein